MAIDRLVAEARVTVRAGRHERGVVLFRRANGLWTGDPFADVPHTPSLAAAATWLIEQRLAAWEEWFDAALAVGPRAELAEFVTAHALRERAAGQLMLALYPSGRQAEALEQYLHVITRDTSGQAWAEARRQAVFCVVGADWEQLIWVTSVPGWRARPVRA